MKSEGGGEGSHSNLHQWPPFKVDTFLVSGVSAYGEIPPCTCDAVRDGPLFFEGGGGGVGKYHKNFLHKKS